jgi:ribosomal protein L16 Arg81 hydroxylase
MSDHADPRTGTQGSREEPQSHLTDTPRGGGWRMFAEPVEVEAFLGETWVPVLVDGVDAESAEIWARWPPVEAHPSEDIHHTVIDASHYRAPAGGFPPA